MIQALGSILIAGGAVWAGFSAAARYRRQVRRMDELALALMLLEQELELSVPELEELAAHGAHHGRGAGKELFGAFLHHLSVGEGQPVRQSWERAVLELEDLPEEGREALLPLGQALGRYESREQRGCIQAVRIRLEKLSVPLRARCQVNCRLSQTVALSGGAFLIILLL